MIVTDMHGKITLINPQAEQILNLQRGEAIGANIHGLLPLTGRLITKCLDSGKSQLGSQIRWKNVHLMANITPVHSNGLVVGAVLNFQRLRQFEKSAQSLDSYKRLNKQLETIFESSFDGIWLCDNIGYVINVNRASEILNGVKAKDIIDKNVSDLVTRGLFDKSVTLEVLETKRQVSIMQYVKRTRKYLLVTGTPSFDESGNIYLVVVNERDITQLNAIRGELEQSRMEAERFKDELSELNTLQLQEHQMIVASEKMRHIVRIAFKLARIDASNILILGESGTGKGLLAKFIHMNSKRSAKPFVQINCAALPENLLEAELFGYEKGAFTGASSPKPGKIELANQGTLFLDEIGELNFQLQTKLLKVLEEKEVERLGGTITKKIDFRLITATNRDIQQLLDKNCFRLDLYYRINTLHLQIPPLRDRKNMLRQLIFHFVDIFSEELNRRGVTVPEATMDFLLSYSWPGNIRELENSIKRALILLRDDSSTLRTGDFQFLPVKHDDAESLIDTISDYIIEQNISFKDLEKKVIKQIINHFNGDIIAAINNTVISKNKFYRHR